MKNSVRFSLSKPNKDSSDFSNNIKKIAKWGRIDRITPKISPDLSDEMESFNTLIKLEPGWIEEETGRENEKENKKKEKFVKNELEKILNSGKNLEWR